MSRWRHWSNSEDKKGYNYFSEQGNPSAALGPAERARQLGLQSNGRGGYIDPNSGQVVARTVNNELIFYDNNSATGGAINDGSGGAALTQAAPSWADPLTGMLTTPPSKAETPSEIAAIPDPTPALAPVGYNSFMQKKKEQAYQMNQIAPQPARMTPDEMEQQDQQDQEMATQADAGQQQAFAAENKMSYGMFESQNPGGDAAKRMAAAYERNKSKIEQGEQKALEARMKANGEGGYDIKSLAKRTQGLGIKPIQTLLGRSRSQTGVQSVQNTQQGSRPQVDINAPQSRLDVDGDGDTDLDDLKELREKFIEAHGVVNMSENKRRKIMDVTWKPFEDLLNGMDKGDKRTNMIRNMLKNMKFEDRLNSGAGIGELGRNDVEILRDRKKEMLKTDFSNRDSVREYTNGLKDENITDEMATIAFNALPKKIKAQLTNKGNAAGAGPRSKLHYNGVDADGNVRRGTSGGKDRAIQMLKLLMQTGFTDGYTQQPLDLNSWDLEHVMPASAASDDDDFQFRESPDNWLPVAFNVNKAKSDLSMNDFFKNQVDPLSERLDDDDYWSQKQNVYDYINGSKSGLEGLVSGYLGDADESGMRWLSEDSNLDSFMEMVRGQESKNIAMKNEIRKMIKNGDLPKEARELANKISNKPNAGRALMKMMGGTYMIPKGVNNPNAKSRANAIHDGRYMGVLAHMFGQSPYKQQEIYRAYQNGLENIKATGTEDGFGKTMMDSGLMNPEIIQKLGLGKLFGLMNEEIMPEEPEEDEGIDIQSFLKMILPLLAKK
jgi:hypothetical protein